MGTPPAAWSFALLWLLVRTQPHAVPKFCSALCQAGTVGTASSREDRREAPRDALLPKRERIEIEKPRRTDRLAWGDTGNLWHARG